MNDLNDSVIICETEPSSNQRKTMPTKEKKKAINTKKKTFYECSLRHIQLSGKRWEEKMKAKQKLNSNKGKQCVAKNINKKLFSNIETDSLCQDSIIVLSDNECEFVDAEDKDVCKDKKETEKRLMERLNNNCNNPLKRKRSPVLVRSKKRKSIYILDTEDSGTDNESIVPMDSVNQSTDDILVVWSSKSIDLSDTQTKESDIVCEGKTNDNSVIPEKDEAEIVNQEKRNEGEAGKKTTVNQEKRNEGEAGKKTTVNQDKETDELEEGEIIDEKNEGEVITVTRAEDNRLFMIDCTPEPKNLHCLITGRRYKENMKDNHEREAQMNDDTDLLFNQIGLKLPFAENISSSITMEKPKSFCNTLSKFKKKQSKLRNKCKKPSTSSAQNAASNKLREIVIDGNNVAMSHTNGKSFSEKGLMLVINYFQSRGHLVKVFVPQNRRTATTPMLEKWYTQGVVVFTPSRSIAGKRITPYDDRYILEYATMCKGIVISSDQFRDLYEENPEWRDTIANRLLAPTFVGDIVMFPDDPLGRKGPKLKEFLRH